MADLEIIGAPPSNYVWMVRMACVEKRVPYKLVSAIPHTPEVDAVHPLGKIPAMRHGDVVLAESRAICAYIERMFDGPPLIPTDPVKAAQCEQWLSLVNTAIDPVWLRQYAAGYIFPGTPDKSPNRAQIDAALPKMEKTFPVMAAAVKNGFFVGNSLTLADINFLPTLFYMTKFPESAALVNKHKSLKAYLERHSTRKSFIETMPQQTPADAVAAAQAQAANSDHVPQAAAS